MFRIVLLICVLTVSAGCAPPPDDATEKTDRESVFDDQIETLDRAKSTEQEIMDADKERRRALEEQGG